MAIEQQQAHSTTPQVQQGPVISPAIRRRIQSWYQHGREKAHAGSHDYATDMFVQCVEGDPANLEYLNSFLHNLHKKYNDNKKGAGFTSALKASGMRASSKKAQIKKDWPGLIKQSLELLKLNPWDTGALMSMAQGCEGLHCLEAQLAWLRAALDVDPKDPDTNKACALALGKQGHFDQAIVCWARVEKAKPHDAEAQKAIGDLQVRKTESQLIKRTEQHAAASKAAPAAPLEGEGGEPQIRLTRQQELQQEISGDPNKIDSYVELAELHARENRFTEAERICRVGLEASGGDLKLRELYEDMSLRHARHQVQIAEQRANDDHSDEAQTLYLRMRQELNRREIEIFRTRAERYPAISTWKYELGTRLKRAQNYSEAIKVFQDARNDPKRRGQVLLELGECFQQIKQYKLAMDHYKQAVEALADREADTKKKALYRAGVLAMGLDDLDAAEKYLTDLAGMEFAYRDVAERLDKIAQVRHKG